MKTKPLPNVIGGYFTDSPFQNMKHEEFVEWCGGRLATALFKGEFNRELYQLITMANARGMKRQVELDNETRSKPQGKKKN